MTGEVIQLDTGGRPSKYTPELLEMAERYVENYEDFGDVVPTVCGLALACGVSKSTLNAWRSDKGKPEFADLFEQLLAEQEVVLLDKGHSGEFNPTIVKLMLANHGYHEKIERVIVVRRSDTNDQKTQA